MEKTRDEINFESEQACGYLPCPEENSQKVLDKDLEQWENDGSGIVWGEQEG